MVFVMLLAKLFKSLGKHLSLDLVLFIGAFLYTLTPRLSPELTRWKERSAYLRFNDYDIFSVVSMMSILGYNLN